LDANIIIYLATAEGGQIADALEQRNEELACSEMARLEVLGFPNLLAPEKIKLQHFFAACRMFPIDQIIIDRAIALRQERSIKSPDAIIAATALEHDSELWTANTRDFDKVANLRWYDPLARS
jgi:predicted nucleic acid-binding protein